MFLIEEEFGTGKPDPRIYLATLEQLHLAADKTWMVGDHLWFDIAAPQRLGILTIWLDHLVGFNKERLSGFIRCPSRSSHPPVARTARYFLIFTLSLAILHHSKTRAVRYYTKKHSLDDESVAGQPRQPPFPSKIRHSH
jgi:hypothetical protein